MTKQETFRQLAAANPPVAPAPAPEEETTEEAAEEGRRMDPEIRVISAMLRLLDKLPEPAKGRIVAYIASRYQEQGNGAKSRPE